MTEFDFAEWLAEEMDRQGISINELAEKAGVHRLTIQYYLEYKRLPNLATMLIILDALGKRIEIVGKDGKHESDL